MEAEGEGSWRVQVDPLTTLFPSIESFSIIPISSLVSSESSLVIYPGFNLKLLYWHVTTMSHVFYPASGLLMCYWMTFCKNLRLWSVRRCTLMHQRSLIFVKDLGRWRTFNKHFLHCTCTFIGYLSTQSGREVTAC